MMGDDGNKQPISTNNDASATAQLEDSWTLFFIKTWVWKKL